MASSSNRREPYDGIVFSEMERQGGVKRKIERGGGGQREGGGRSERGGGGG